MTKVIKLIPDLIVLIIIYIFLLRKWKKKRKREIFLYTLMYIYVSAVMFLTVMPIITTLPEIFNHEYIPMKMNLFEDYFEKRPTAILEMCLNVVMTVPFGFMLPIIKNKKFFYTTFFTFLLSLSIEIVQPLLHNSRVSDITDIVTNVLGGIVGYMIYLLFKPIINKIKLPK